MTSETSPQPYIDTNALAFALPYAMELAENQDSQTRALAVDKLYRTFSHDQAEEILKFIDRASRSTFIKNANAYQKFVDAVEKYRMGSITPEEALVRLIDACIETPRARVAQSLSAFLPQGWCISADSRGFGFVRTNEQRDFLLFGPFGGMVPPPVTKMSPSHTI